MRKEEKKDRWPFDKADLRALVIFAGSRLIMLLAIYFAAMFVQQNPAGEFWNANDRWYHYLLRYDSGWFMKISEHGYTYNGDDLIEQPVVFFPLYPLLSRAVRFLFNSGDASVLIVSNLSILIAAPLFFKLVREDYGDVVAYGATALLAFFPTAMFFSAGYSESLAFLLIVAFFLLLKRERFLWASACCGLAMATRFTNLVCLLPLAWELWRRFSGDWKKLAMKAALCMTIATSGLWLYMFYLWWAFRKPLAFLTGQHAWQGGETGSNLVRALTLQPFAYLAGIWHQGPNPNTLDPWFFLIFLFTILLFRKKLTVSYLIYALGLLLVPYITRSGGSLEFQSISRYILLAFPVFIIMGHLFIKRLWLGLTVAGLFAAMLFMYTAMYAQWYWVG